MHRLIRFGRLLSIALWVGGLVLFAFVVAPVAFSRLPSSHEAGLVVGGTLRMLHLLGLICGAVFLFLTLLSARALGRRSLLTQLALSAIMLAITAASQFGILPAMESARAAAGGDVAAVASNNPDRLRFDQLHGLSEKLEGLVLLCGLVVLFTLSSEAPTTPLPSSSPLDTKIREA